MSTIAYAEFTTKREQAAPGTSMSQSPPGISTFQDALAALVPAEVLALHAVILPFTTKTEQTVTTITEKSTLAWAFWGLMVISILLYIAPRLLKGKWTPVDYIRMLIPPLAFVGWTMIQRATAFDAVFPNLADAPRTLIALFIAALLGILATFLGNLADQKQPEPNPGG